MTRLRKAIFGYDVKQVNQHLKWFKYLSELEISEAEYLVEKARKELAQLGHESTTPVNIELTAIEETSVGLVEEVEYLEAHDLLEEVEKVDEVELKESAVLHEDIEFVVTDEITEEDKQEQLIVMPDLPERDMNRMGRLLMFRRKMDVDIVSSEHTSELEKQVDSYGYWESIDHYLKTPEISETLLSEQSVTANYVANSQNMVTNSAVGLPRYFDYNLSDVQTQFDVDASQSIERRTRRETPSIKSRNPREATGGVTTNQLPNKSEVSAVQSQGSKEITREVRQLRYKYIVGKWAGEDLVNNQGQLIVSKNNPITEEIVDSADQEGKLALLIVHMIIPGLGEDI